MIKMLMLIMRKRALKRIRAQLRAYRRLKKMDTPFEHMLFYKDEISLKSLRLPSNATVGLFPKELAFEMETAIRQRLSVVLLKDGILADLACAITGTVPKIVLPAPKAWRHSAKSGGVKIHSLASRFAWLGIQLKLLWSGIRIFLGYIKRHLLHSHNYSNKQPYAVFIDVGKRALPETIDVTANHWDLINWYRRSRLYVKGVEKIWFHLKGEMPDYKVSPDIEVVSHPFPRLDNTKFIKFVIEGAVKCLWAFCSLIIGRWWAPVILREVLDYTYVRQIPIEQRACDYFFHNTIKNVRPLWTFEVERTGSRVTCILFSHHIGIIKPGAPETAKIDLEYAYLSWGRYAVWDTDHEKAILDCGSRPAEFVKVGPVSMVDDIKTLPDLPENAVGVFDINSIRPTLEMKNGLVRPYFTIVNMLDFLDQACLAIIAAGGVPIIKPKGGFKHAYFQGHRFQEIVERYNCICLDSGTSVVRLSQELNAIIACPFTSIASYGKLFGTPACYFDPTGSLAGFESYTHGNDLIIGKSNLENWLTEILNNDLQQDQVMK